MSDELDYTTPYLVRMADGHEVVGVFAAGDEHELALLVDQCVDPAMTEFMPLPAGGVFVPGRVEAQWPARAEVGADGEIIDIKAEDADPLAGSRLDGAWQRACLEGTWLPLVHLNEPGIPTDQSTRLRQ